MKYGLKNLDELSLQELEAAKLKLGFMLFDSNKKFDNPIYKEQLKKRGVNADELKLVNNSAFYQLQDDIEEEIRKRTNAS